MSMPTELRNHAADMQLLPYIYSSSSLFMPDNVKATDQSKSLIVSEVTPYITLRHLRIY